MTGRLDGSHSHEQEGFYCQETLVVFTEMKRKGFSSSALNGTFTQVDTSVESIKAYPLTFRTLNCVSLVPFDSPDPLVCQRGIDFSGGVEISLFSPLVFILAHVLLTYSCLGATSSMSSKPCSQSGPYTVKVSGSDLHPALSDASSWYL